MKTSQTISQYIAAAPEEARSRLRQMRATIAKVAPDAVEGIKWSMPAFSYKRILVTFAAFKYHIGFYPTPSGTEKFKKELSKYKYAKGSVKFPLSGPIPLSLINKIVKFRVKELTKTSKLY